MNNPNFPKFYEHWVFEHVAPKQKQCRQDYDHLMPKKPFMNIPTIVITHTGTHTL